MEQRHWQLWWVAVTVIVAMTIAILGLYSPETIGAPSNIGLQLSMYLTSFSLLIILFCGYVLQTSHQLGKTKKQLWQTELKKVNVQATLLRRVEERSAKYLQVNQQLEQEVIERRQAEERFMYLAHHDRLTDLPNRVVFMDRLTQALTRAPWHNRMVGVLYLDLDHFKRINDTLGHDVGDQLLIGVAKRVQESLRDGDTVARMGGDEFTIILADVAHDRDISRVAQKILNTLSTPLLLGGHELFVTASIGVSIFPNDGDNAQTLLKHADTAMYRSKDKGRNSYQHYSTSMNIRTIEHLSMENGFRHALERNEFVLYYQPIVDISSGQIVGMEGLLRWQHPVLGIVSPSQLLPLAEETGLIIPINRWALQTACAQHKVWRDAGLRPVRMAMNLSLRQFQNENLVQTVTQVLKEKGMNPAYLDLELTETIMQNTEQSIEKVKQLHQLGVQLSIDDFGTGYSSLGQLGRFPIQRLKIDQPLIHNLLVGPKDAAIVESIITLAHTLKIHVTAEAVETPEQLDFLQAHHCDEMQGFLFSRPLTVEQATLLLTEN